MHKILRKRLCLRVREYSLAPRLDDTFEETEEHECRSCQGRLGRSGVTVGRLLWAPTVSTSHGTLASI
eukprot:1120496-Rhodomonas_salina.1